MKQVVTVFLGLVLLATIAGPVQAQESANLERTELMLHGLIAVHASVVLTMEAYEAGLLTKEEAQAAVARNKAFLTVLNKSANAMRKQAALGVDDGVGFAQDFLQICNYIELALESFKTYLGEGSEHDRDIFDRHITRAENAVTRLLSGEADAE